MPYLRTQHGNSCAGASRFPVHNDADKAREREGQGASSKKFVCSTHHPLRGHIHTVAISAEVVVCWLTDSVRFSGSSHFFASSTRLSESTHRNGNNLI